MTPARDVHPLVSVIIPAHNAAKYIEETLKSVLAQTHRNMEVLVVDDGSTDETAAIVKTISARDSRVRLFKQANAGVAASRNRALLEACGEFVAPIDADDTWFPLKLERQLDCMRSAANSVGLVYTWVLVIDAGGKVREAGAHDFEGDVFVDLIFSNFVGCASSPLIRRACFDVVGGYEEGFKEQKAQGSEDWDLYLRLAERFEFRVVPEFLVCYRQTPDSMSRQFVNMERSHRLIMENIRERRPGLPRDIIRWSMSNYCSYLVSKCYDKGRYWTSIHYVLSSVWHDPLRLLSGAVYLTILKCILRIVSQPVIPLFWKDRAAWDSFCKRIRIGIWPEPSKEDLLRNGSKSHSVTYFKLAHQKRMVSLKKRSRGWTAPPRAHEAVRGFELRHPQRSDGACL